MTGLCFYAQQKNALQPAILEHVFNDYAYQQPPPRRFVSLKNKSLSVKLNPLTYIFGSLIFIYQRGFSEQIQANCTYEVSCSNYAKRCMERYGMIKGLLMGVDQLSCCFSGVTDEHERCYINSEGKVINLPAED